MLLEEQHLKLSSGLHMKAYMYGMYTHSTHAHSHIHMEKWKKGGREEKGRDK